MRYAPYKILASIFDVCGQGKGADGKIRDRGDAAKVAQTLVARIEQKILATGEKSISTKELIRLVGDELEENDRAAFYRYGAFSPHKQDVLGL